MLVWICTLIIALWSTTKCIPIFNSINNKYWWLLIDLQNIYSKRMSFPRVKYFLFIPYTRKLANTRNKLTKNQCISFQSLRVKLGEFGIEWVNCPFVYDSVAAWGGDIMRLIPINHSPSNVLLIVKNPFLCINWSALSQFRWHGPGERWQSGLEL